ncbi:MAG TPA: hypothetical protein VG676_12800 [Chitinophagaceae bacterium]|nr:hypothetical protein [Chitinophagaceae bacterium]
MKKHFLPIAILLSIAANSTAQQKPGSQQPSQKEIQEMMKQAQNEMENMSPQDKKTMDSLGIKMPRFNQLSSADEKKLQKVIDEEDRNVPVRDAARINSISKTPLTKGTLAAYLQSAHLKVAQQLFPEARSKGEEIYQLIKKENETSRAMGNAAAAFWMMGRVEIALYIAGKSCTDDPSNTNNLSNYAAMLSMAGAGQISIPLLEYINKKSPGNSTILNNLGQAWFSLGEITKAGKYLDSAIHLFPTHPQANFTKCFIELNKGSKQAAVEAMKKSINGGYTKEKEDILRKQGYKTDGKDVNWTFPRKPDPLGLETFHIPPYPLTVEQCIVAEKEWDAFRAACNDKLAGISRNIVSAREIMIRENDKRTKGYTAFVQQAMKDPSAPPIPDLLPFFADKASLKIKLLTADRDGSYSYQLKRSMQRIREFSDKELPAIRKKYQAAIDSINAKEAAETGEGKRVPDYCPAKQALTNAYLRTANSTLEQLWNDYYDIQRRYLNELTYWNQFVLWKDQFEMQKLGIQSDWLNLIQTPHFESIAAYTCNTKEPAAKMDPLPDFNEINCQYHSELKLYVGTITTDCNRMTSELNLKFVKLGLTEDLSKEKFLDQFVSCSLELNEDAGVDKEIGPLKAEAGLGGGIRLEFDRSGLKDVIVKAEAKAGVGTRVTDEVKKETDIKTSAGGVGISDLGFGDESLEIGVKGEISIISGKGSAESTGILEGVFKK